MIIEKRSYSEVRVADGNRLIGYAAVFDSESFPLPFMETIRRGAFDETLARRDDVAALREHKPELIIARSSAGTLTLRQDDKGLIAEIDPANTQVGREAVELVRRGDLRHMSIGFEVVDDAWATRDGKNWREIRKATLGEVSIVAFPAYDATDIAIATRNQPATLGVNWAAARTRRLALDRSKW